MPTIKFTPAECAALLHRLEIPDVIAEVFADNDHLEHMAGLAAAEAEDLARQLTNYGHAVIDDSTSPSLQQETRRAVLVEAIEGSMWIAVHDNNETSHQMLAAARRALESATRKVEAALGEEVGSITIPEA